MENFIMLNYCVIDEYIEYMLGDEPLKWNMRFILILSDPRYNKVCLWNVYEKQFFFIRFVLCILQFEGKSTHRERIAFERSFHFVFFSLIFAFPYEITVYEVPITGRIQKFVCLNKMWDDLPLHATQRMSIFVCVYVREYVCVHMDKLCACACIYVCMCTCMRCYYGIRFMYARESAYVSDVYCVVYTQCTESAHSNHIWVCSHIHKS